MRCTIVILFCCYNIFVFAQDKKQVAADQIQLAGAGSYFIETASLSARIKAYAYPFDSIIFKDIRFDTATVGVSNKLAFFSEKNKFRYVKFSDGLSGFLNELINDPSGTHNNANADQLTCYIKKFRITELDSAYELDFKKGRQVQIRSAVDAYYYYDNRMYPAFRTDTGFVQYFSENRTAYFIIDSLLRAFCVRAGKIDKQKLLQKKSYTRESVDSVYQQRFNIPILNTTAFKKGIYANAREFFRNEPSITEYEWKSDKVTNILYTKDEKGQWLVTRKDVFGFCDGTNIWFRVSNDFYPAFRRENTFEFIAPMLLKRMIRNQSSSVYTPGGGAISSIPTTKQYEDESVYEIDMETGEFY